MKADNNFLGTSKIKEDRKLQHQVNRFERLRQHAEDRYRLYDHLHYHAQQQLKMLRETK